MLQGLLVALWQLLIWIAPVSLSRGTPQRDGELPNEPGNKLVALGMGLGRSGNLCGSAKSYYGHIY